MAFFGSAFFNPPSKFVKKFLALFVLEEEEEEKEQKVKENECTFVCI